MIKGTKMWGSDGVTGVESDASVTAGGVTV